MRRAARRDGSESPIVDALRARFDVTIETVTNAVENVHFPAPRELRVRA